MNPVHKPIGLGTGRAVLLSVPMALLSAMLVLAPVFSASEPSPLASAAALVTWVLLVLVFFLMLRTGHTHRYRRALYVAVAVCFVVSFLANLLEVRGSMALSEANMIAGETPFCHIVIPMILIPAAVTRTIIFPGSLLTGFASIATMVVLWIGATLATGRGWCSWICFYGGLDEGFSQVARKPVLRHIDRRWTYLPFAVLLAVVLTSAVALSPTYCEWLCPYKAVTEFAAVTSVKTAIQTVIFVGLFAGLVVVLPILSKRRIQCGLFCPFGAMQSLLNKISIFDVCVDRSRCTDCGLCIRTCPTFSIHEEDVKRGQAGLTCTRCGACADACPRQAISFHVKGTAAGVHPQVARVLFLYPAYLFLAAVGGGMIVGALYRILRLLTTGSMIG
ncbi:MAG: 4Fe-4S binding protein [Anaerolineae bacterium]